jgi:hypothetical protein
MPIRDFDANRAAWARAVALADAGDFGELRRLILAGDAVPAEYRQALADFASGKRAPTRARGQRARVSAARARQIREAFAAITADDPEIDFQARTPDEARALIAEAVHVAPETVRDVVEYRKTYARRKSRGD